MERPHICKNLHNLRGERFFPFNEQKAKALVKDLVRLLLKMERMGIVHGDIKPRNVLYDFEKGACKLIDFGSARYFQKGERFSQFQGKITQVKVYNLFNVDILSNAVLHSLNSFINYIVTDCLTLDIVCNTVL